MHGIEMAVLAGQAAFDDFDIVGGQGAERGYLDDLPPEVHVHDAEAAADDAGVAEQAPDVFRSGVGGDVEILRLQAQQQVAHAAADDEGVETGFIQLVEDFEAVRADLLPGDAVFRPADHLQIGGRGQPVLRAWISNVGTWLDLGELMAFYTRRQLPGREAGPWIGRGWKWLGNW